MIYEVRRYETETGRSGYEVWAPVGREGLFKQVSAASDQFLDYLYDYKEQLPEYLRAMIQYKLMYDSYEYSWPGGKQ